MPVTSVTGLPVLDILAAIGGLGTASFALVDGAKAFSGGPSRGGFRHIRRVIKRLYPENADEEDRAYPLSLGSVLDTLFANWINGTALADQKAIAKSLIKLRLTDDNAPFLARVTGVKEDLLSGVARKMTDGTQLTQPESDVLGRFDLILTALLDEGYQRADQLYRNSAKMWSVVVSVILALIGGAIVGMGTLPDFGAALLIGLLATPLAPLSKDLTSALQASVKAMQLLRK
ncbi:hypothetical protein [Thiobacillus sp. 0-1251]|uniref:hypothetical protein n=1 Tax=Thiobacillus sp. 0-1251 TaxID=1895858 RepID=UPI000A8DFC21|nr:hypothetical protein [Thiobacillus sp. 0-1251]